MPVPSSPATFTLSWTPGSQPAPQSVTFAIPAGTYSGVTVRTAGSIGGGPRYLSKTLATTGFWSTNAAANYDSGEQPLNATDLAAINAAAGGNWTVNYADQVVPSDTNSDSVTLLQITLQGATSPPGGGSPTGSVTLQPVITPGGGTSIPPELQDPGILAQGLSLDSVKPAALGWFKDNRYYLSMGMRTLVLDVLTSGWSDTGWGYISAAQVFAQQGYPEDMLLVQGTPQQRGTSVCHSHKMLTLRSENIIQQSGHRVILGPFDGEGPDRERRKWAKRLWVWGDFAPVDNVFLRGGYQQIGTVTLVSDTGYQEQAPIIPWRLLPVKVANPPTIYGPQVLFMQEFLPGAVGRVLLADVQLTVAQAEIRQAMLEYVPLN